MKLFELLERFCVRLEWDERSSDPTAVAVERAEWRAAAHFPFLRTPCSGTASHGSTIFLGGTVSHSGATLSVLLMKALSGWQHMRGKLAVTAPSSRPTFEVYSVLA